MRGLGLAIALGVLSQGCLGSAFIDARVNEARDTEDALDTLHDYEIGKTSAEARVANLEGLYAASGGDSRVALLLARAWLKLSFAFILDDYELARENGNVPEESYHRTRALAGFRRGQFYADAWLEQRAPGFSAALADEPALSTWLGRNLRAADAAEALLWAGIGRMGHASTAPADSSPLALERLRTVGTTLLRHSLSVGPNTAAGLAHVGLALGAALSSTPDLALAERELALGQSAAPGRLLVRLTRARTLGCQRQDRRTFEGELDRVLREGDPDPRLRLENAVVKRRARRYFTSRAIAAECFGAKTETSPSPPESP